MHNKLIDHFAKQMAEKMNEIGLPKTKQNRELVT